MSGQGNEARPTLDELTDEYIFDYSLVQDKVPFKDWETGLTCLVWNMGHWNGYVQVPPGHIFYGKTYHQCVKPDCQDRSDYLSEFDGTPYDHCGHTAEAMLDVHGGITFSGELPSLTEGWWLGFDTAHLGDSPTIQDKDYVIQETLRLAKQLV